jgi:hypothetical protein
MHRQIAVTLNTALIFQTLQKPLDGSVLCFGFVGIELLAYLPSGQAICLPKQIHHRQFRICQLLLFHFDNP